MNSSDPHDFPWPTYLLYGLGWMIGGGLFIFYVGMCFRGLSKLGDPSLGPSLFFCYFALLAAFQGWVLWVTVRDHYRQSVFTLSLSTGLWIGTLISGFVGFPGGCLVVFDRLMSQNPW